MCKSNRKTIIDIICAAFFVISAIVFLLNYKIIRVDGESMEPTLHNKDIILISLNPSKINKSDIIVFNHDGNTCIKRIVAVEGDNVTIKDNKLQVNGIFISNVKSTVSNKSYKLKTDELFVLGDKYKDSIDSSDYGPITTQNIIGKKW